MDNNNDVIVNELMCILPGNIIVNILSRLPVNSLVKLRCVKKSWYNLIKDPRFIELHERYLSKVKEEESLVLRKIEDSQTELLIVPRGSGTFEKLELPELGNFTIVGSSKGLVCLTRFNPMYRIEFKVMNPALREHRDAYKASRLHDSTGQVVCTCVGFGFDEKNRDFKILRLERFKQDERWCVEINIYSLRSNSWKTIQDLGNVALRFVGPNSVATSVGSCLYWLSYAGDETTRKYAITGFDLSSETFHEIPLPKLRKFGRLTRIVAWKQSLALLHPNHGRKGYEVWSASPEQILINNTSWELKTMLAFYEFPAITRIRGVQYPDLEMYCVLNKKTGYFNTWRIKNVFGKPMIMEHMSNCHFFSYRESLVSISTHRTLSMSGGA